MSGVPLNIDWQQILLHLFNFVILFAILYFLLYKPIKNFIEKRKALYNDMDDKANSNLQEAEKLKSDYLAKISNADKEIEEHKLKMIKDAEEKAAVKLEEAQKEAEKIISKAKSDAEKERKKIVSEANDEITQIAKDVAAKAVFGSVSEAYDSFLDKAEDINK